MHHTTRPTATPPTRRLPLHRWALTALTALIVLTGLPVLPAFGGEPARDWVKASNAITREVLKTQGRLQPEFASQQGLTEFDGLTVDLGPGIDRRTLATFAGLTRDLQQRLARERHPALRQDLQILIDALALESQGVRLRQRHLMAWTDAPEVIFHGLNSLLDAQSTPERRAKALPMLQRYLGSHPGTRPLTELAQERFEESRRPGRVGPYAPQVDQAIAKAPTYAQGIRALFGQWQIEGAESTLALMDRQFAAHAEWQARVVRPLTRPSSRLPGPVYAHQLRQVGIDIPPMALIESAQASFQETRSAMQALAPVVARAKGLDTNDYREVIRALKKEALPQDQLVAHYLKVNRQLEDIIRREGIVTLPERPMGMRLATEAESAAQPAPYMQAPPLVDNTGQQGVFVLTVRNPSAGQQDLLDDFSFPAASWTLSAHEGRPGHELQFSAMVERGTSLARALYAFNSVNVEGWALYAETLVLPHEPPEGQLIALQLRLLRTTRAMLDPMVNLGLTTPEEAARVLREEVALSPAMVRQEIDRYTFRAPGQAGSYFHGYMQLLQLRTDTELALGPRFDLRAFNDFLLDQGLLSPRALGKAVRERFVRARAAQGQ